MGRVSSIKRLPPEIRERLDAWIRDESVTQTEAAERVNELLAELYPDHPPVSRQAVNRYDLSMREIGERIQQARAVSEAWVAKLGSQPSGRIGFLVTETLKVLSLEVTQKLAGGELDAESLPATIDQLNKLALAAQRLTRSEAESERRERLIREEERRLAAEEAAEAAGSAARSQGLSAETADAIRRKILGIGT